MLMKNHIGLVDGEKAFDKRPIRALKTKLREIQKELTQLDKEQYT